MVRHGCFWLGHLLLAAMALAQPPLAQPPLANQLGAETSPYLLLHRNQPVHWQPWGEAAFARARQENKPVFLSVGYSACHWCHVMSAESFSDPELAKVLNEHFICIKVDREERPDVDDLYMAAVQAMGQHGGWPLSVWMTPDRQPFFGGTYFPPEDRHGKPGFRRVLLHLQQTWQNERADLQAGAADLTKHLQRVLAPNPAPGEPTRALVDKLLPQAEAQWDAEFAGFARAPHFAPKFPGCNELQALLASEQPRGLEMAVAQLRALQAGGIHDQLGGGFHRYSTDRQWLVPHFEKMLYDNAQLADLYLTAFVRTGDGAFAATAVRTLDYLLAEMQSEAGGFFASQDAQSDGEEGKYFVWSKTEFDAVLGPQASAAAPWFGVQAAGNWQGSNVLHAAMAVPSQEQAAWLAARHKLLQARNQRVRPATDDKVIAGWNALAIVACARGAVVLGEERYLAAARRAADFVLREMVTSGRVQRSYRGKVSRVPGFLDDQAGMAWALLELFQADPQPRWLLQAKELLQVLVVEFGTPTGNFTFAGKDHEVLPAASAGSNESSLPSGTSLAVRALQQASLLCADPALHARAWAALRAQHRYLSDVPFQFPSLTTALQYCLHSSHEVVVVGEPADPRTQALLSQARRSSRAGVVVHLHASNHAALAELSLLFRGKVQPDQPPRAFVCHAGSCEAPVTDAAALAKLLQ